MKKSVAVTTFVIVNAFFLALPILIPRAMAKPLYGDFLIPGGTCSCGHLLFFSIDETEAFDYCPGHDSRELMGTVVRNDTSVIVTHNITKKPFFRLDYDSGIHTVTVFDSEGNPAGSESIEQSRNWYRIWWQRFRP